MPDGQNRITTIDFGWFAETARVEARSFVDSL
jgi:hypothetical protein